MSIEKRTGWIRLSWRFVVTAPMPVRRKALKHELAKAQDDVAYLTERVESLKEQLWGTRVPLTAAREALQLVRGANVQPVMLIRNALAQVEAALEDRPPWH